jgi:hypothetical protein
MLLGLQMDRRERRNIRACPRNRAMKTRWAVALAPNEPLVIDTVDLDGPDPRGGDVRARLQRLDVIL